jgi:hypothetical protein
MLLFRKAMEQTIKLLLFQIQEEMIDVRQIKIGGSYLKPCIYFLYKAIAV